MAKSQAPTRAYGYVYVTTPHRTGGTRPCYADFASQGKLTASWLIAASPSAVQWLPCIAGLKFVGRCNQGKVEPSRTPGPGLSMG